ncbi:MULTISPECIES: uroporphyrinogen decarboxylase family protein [unclassified Dehalobacter]|uniref:uroporphyrinogen decarboxylase family protein n=1 Tax=unclassified Dehalobacter TaxID=2635733 RepID=UPI0003728237|nr:MULTISPECIES: uroporphyrinogen decarboxylase family protein [unclassified Dehalobacter]RJE48964.1 uroporphyrinogen decarboxylase [Dehalobacter sp. MCB1]TCX50766.1 uroporphyrinogen decarboxylase [Dehalobacter sp. 12DCB1]TCX51701.1 uroporphyrinogen decarboxylase [Dehalobacter sp. 14DCB1]
MSEVANLYQERLERVFKAFNLEQPDRVPLLGTYGSWCAEFAGYTDAETNWDMEKGRKAMMKVVTEIPLDMVHRYFPRPGGVYQALGSKAFHYLSDSTVAQYSDEHAQIMTADEYPEFAKDPFKFLVEKILPRKYAELAKPSPVKELALAKGAMKFGMFGAQSGAIVGAMAGQYGMPKLVDATIIHSMDWIADFFRGIKNAFMDIRRCPGELLAAIEAFTPLVIRFGMSQLNMVPPKQYPKVVYIPMHLPTMLKTSDFNKFYWPSFKKIMEFFASQDINVVPIYEGDWSRYYDHLQELPAKKSMGWFEYGNPKEIKDKLGDTMCISGLYPATLLQFGTKEECIAKAKELVDILAPGGGYVFCTDKEIITGKAENIIAVNKFVKEYGIY